MSAPKNFSPVSERILEYQVPEGLRGVRADKVFASAFDSISRVRLQKAFDLGQVSFDGRIIDKRFKINQSGCLRAVLIETPSENKPVAKPIPLDICYEDESLVVINKASGMVTHPGNGTGEDTLVHAVLNHCQGVLSSVGAPERPGIVHRLDKDTSGLIIVAKTDLAHHKLAEAFSERSVKKRYLALISGQPVLESGSCFERIGRHPTQRTKMAVQTNPKGREAHTDWRLLQRLGDRAALIECCIHTGRTHQIRVHMQHMGFPLLGDSVYGFKKNRFPNCVIERVYLHASELAFEHPQSGEPLNFSAEMPDDFSDMIAHLKEGS